MANGDIVDERLRSSIYYLLSTILYLLPSQHPLTRRGDVGAGQFNQAWQLITLGVAGVGGSEKPHVGIFEAALGDFGDTGAEGSGFGKTNDAPLGVVFGGKF